MDEIPPIFPNYNDIVIPPNIAPLNFMVDNAEEITAEFRLAGKGCFSVTSQNGIINIPSKKWSSLLNEAKGQTFHIHLSIWNNQYPEGANFLPIEIKVAEEDIDNWIVSTQLLLRNL